MRLLGNLAVAALVVVCAALSSFHSCNVAQFSPLIGSESSKNAINAVSDGSRANDSSLGAENPFASANDRPADPLSLFAERERSFSSSNAQCNETHRPKYYHIKAERHHGSNLMRLLIDWHSNLIEARKQKDWVDWKHGFLLNPLAYPHSLERYREVAMLIITRDVFHWLPYMHREAYGQMNYVRNRTFSEFIRAPYRETCHELREFKRSVKNCIEPYEEADNLVQVRTQKYKNWLFVDPGWLGQRARSIYAFSHRSHIRYESLVEEGQEATLRRFLGDHCTPMMQRPFRPVTGRASWHGEKQIMRNGKPENYVVETDEEVLSLYSKDDLRFVLSQLDLDFERRVLNYTYDYVEKYLQNTSALGNE